MGKASVHVTKSKKTTKAKVKMRKGSARGNPNKCPICGKFTSKG